MSKLLINIFSDISSDTIFDIGEKSKISREKVDQVCFDCSEVILLNLRYIFQHKKEVVEKFDLLKNNSWTDPENFFKNKKKVVKIISKKNGIGRKSLEVFLDNIQVLFLEGVGHAVEKNNLDLDIFIKILKMSCDVQQKESEDKKGILTKISFEKKSFVNKLLFIKKVI